MIGHPVTDKLAALFHVREVPDSKPDPRPFIISENFRAFPQDLRTGMKMAPLFLSIFFPILCLLTTVSLDAILQRVA